MDKFSPETSEIAESSDCFEDLTYRKSLWYALCPKIYKMNSNTFYFPKYYFLKFVILYFFLNNFIIPIVFYFGDELDTIIIIVIPLSSIAQLIVSCVVFIEYYIANYTYNN